MTSSNPKSPWRGRLLALFLILVAFGLGWFLSGDGDQASGPVPVPGTEDMAQTVHEHAEHGDLVQTTDEEGNVVWTCSMHPQIRLPEPGQCPICFMDLIPVEEGGEEQTRVSLRQINLPREARRLAEIETAKVQRKNLAVQTRLFGKVAYDESRQGAITAWMGGRIERLYIDTTGAPVRRGQPMASIYSPELLTAQAELIQARKTIEELEASGLSLVKETAKRTEAAAREKLRLLGLSKAQIEQVVERGTPSDNITLYAPMSGIVIKKNVVEGVYVDTGTEIYTIADLSKVWVVLEAFEADLPWIELGQTVRFMVEAIPGRTFEGEVIYVDPVVDAATRTVDVRLAANNDDGRLKPGMFVTAVLRAPADVVKKEAEEPLVIPATAPLVTGKRAVVYVVDPDDESLYVGREVVLGPKAGDYYVVRSGLEEGETVVTKGNFKIDSAIQIIAKPSMMSPEGGTTPTDHDHGDMEDMEMEEGEMAPAHFQVPGSFAAKLAELKAHHDEILVQAQTGDLEGATSEAEAFLATLRDIDPAALDQEPTLYWQEFAMLLRNDGVLVREADDPDRLSLVARDLAGHFARLATMFPTTAPEGPVRYDAPPEFRRQLAAVYAAYTDLMEALAGDKLDAAKKTLPEVKEALDGVDMGLLAHDPHMFWMESLYTMLDGIKAMREAEDLVEMRAGFEPLSMGLTQAITSLGMGEGDPVYELFCPMAFDFKGARWLQSDKEVRNPYFGAAMLRCGEVTREVTGDAETTE
jgi:Cu(I)/Ag(I) efflux system membrane fusion protein